MKMSQICYEGWQQGLILYLSGIIGERWRSTGKITQQAVHAGNCQLLRMGWGWVSNHELLSGSWGQLRYKLFVVAQNDIIVCHKEGVWTQESPLRWDASHTQTSSLQLENKKSKMGIYAKPPQENQVRNQQKVRRIHIRNLHREDKIIN